ncbi:MAG: hypothetical protein K9M45_02205 [Kiritimatiellales bacterium]|nr:hypothetical protein [Kiritimatiellales bacterium]
MKVKHGLTFVFTAVLMVFSVVSADAEGDWPRQVNSGGGRTLVYQPQMDRLEGNVLYARAAVSVAPDGVEFPVFGAVWIEARIETDPQTQTVSLREIRVPRVHFADDAITQQKDFSDRLAGAISKLDVKYNRDQMVSMLDLAGKENRDAADFNDAPPKIVVAGEPSFLVSFDGEPQFVAIEGTGLEAAINTPVLVVRHPRSNDHYLYIGGETWYVARAAKGPWVATKNVPAEIRQLEPAEDADGAAELDSGSPPAIVVATEPTELIVTDGPLQPKPLPGNKLLYAINSESHLLFEIDTQRYFVLISGRWFASRSLNGPWEFVPSDGLPASFSEIPSGSEEGVVLNWVSGTELAEKTVLDSYIPQTAAVRRDATITVTYDGPPRFEPIEKTRLYYGVNTGFQVIRYGDKYYCAEQGIWYVADFAEGPWSVATRIPDEVRAIPPSSPVYNTKYVYIYDSTPDVVYFGYYPGYLHSYVYHGGIVYGTGWRYPSWRSRYRYYPRHCTWGYNVDWDPWYGWSTGIRYSSGVFSFTFWDSWWYGYGWWGPSGCRYSHHNRVPVRKTAYQENRHHDVYNIYQYKGNKPRVVTASRNTTGSRFSGIKFGHKQQDHGKDVRVGSDRSRYPEHQGAFKPKPGSGGWKPGTKKPEIVTDRGGHGSSGRGDGKPPGRSSRDKDRPSVKVPVPRTKSPVSPQRPDRVHTPSERPYRPDDRPKTISPEKPRTNQGGRGGSSHDKDQPATRKPVTPPNPKVTPQRPDRVHTPSEHSYRPSDYPKSASPEKRWDKPAARNPVTVPKPKVAPQRPVRSKPSIERPSGTSSHQKPQSSGNNTRSQQSKQVRPIPAPPKRYTPGPTRRTVPDVTSRSEGSGLPGSAQGNSRGGRKKK